MEMNKMTTNIIDEKTVPPVITEQITPLKYLKKEFPKNKFEFQADYKYLFGNENKVSYRINFWIKNKEDRELTQFKGSKISRSYFVELTKKDNSWTNRAL